MRNRSCYYSNLRSTQGGGLVGRWRGKEESQRGTSGSGRKSKLTAHTAVGRSSTTAVGGQHTRATRPNRTGQDRTPDNLALRRTAVAPNTHTHTHNHVQFLPQHPLTSSKSPRTVVPLTDTTMSPTRRPAPRTESKWSSGSERKPVTVACGKEQKRGERERERGREGGGACVRGWGAIVRSINQQRGGEIGGGARSVGIGDEVWSGRLYRPFPCPRPWNQDDGGQGCTRLAACVASLGHISAVIGQNTGPTPEAQPVVGRLAVSETLRALALRALVHVVLPFVQDFFRSPCTTTCPLILPDGLLVCCGG